LLKVGKSVNCQEGISFLLGQSQRENRYHLYGGKLKETNIEPTTGKTGGKRRLTTYFSREYRHNRSGGGENKGHPLYTMSVTFTKGRENWGRGGTCPGEKQLSLLREHLELARGSWGGREGPR